MELKYHLFILKCTLTSELKINYSCFKVMFNFDLNYVSGCKRKEELILKR